MPVKETMPRYMPYSWAWPTHTVVGRIIRRRNPAPQQSLHPCARLSQSPLRLFRLIAIKDAYPLAAASSSRTEKSPDTRPFTALDHYHDQGQKVASHNR